MLFGWSMIKRNRFSLINDDKGETYFVQNKTKKEVSIIEENSIPVSLINGTFATAGFEDKAYLMEQPLEAMFTTTHQKSLISEETYEIADIHSQNHVITFENNNNKMNFNFEDIDFEQYFDFNSCETGMTEPGHNQVLMGESPINEQYNQELQSIDDDFERYWEEQMSTIPGNNNILNEDIIPLIEQNFGEEPPTIEELYENLYDEFHIKEILEIHNKEKAY